MIDSEMQQVQILLLESAEWQREPLYLAVLRFLQRQGAAGATVFRGVAGFGTHSRIHRATLIDVGADLPLMLIWIDRADRVDRLLPQLETMIGDHGLILAYPVHVRPRQQPILDHFPRDLQVRNVMTHDVVQVQPDTPLRDVAELFLHGGLRTVPVVDAERHVAGIITDGDLLRRATAEERPGVLRMLVDRLLGMPASHARRLLVSGRSAASVMTSPVVTIDVDAPPTEAIRLMMAHGIKRLPVVDAQGQLVGLIGRAGVLQALSEAT